MYDFIQPTERDQPKQGMSIQTVFNHVNLDEELTDNEGSFKTLTISGRGTSTQRINTFSIQGMDGVYEDGEPTLEPRTITVRFRVSDKSNDGFQQRTTRLKSLLRGAKNQLVFTDENALFYATQSSLELPEETSNTLTGTIYFFCSDPFKYGQEQTLHFPSDLVLIQNNGTAPADPIFELTATKKSTFAMIGNQDDEYMMLGQPADDDVQEVDTRTTVLQEGGETISEWTPTQDKEMLAGDNHIDSLSGVMSGDQSGVQLESYGDPLNHQRGAAVYKELSTAIEDFEVESTFDIISTQKEENFRMVVYLLDENLNNIGHFGVIDNSGVYKRRLPISQLGVHQEGPRLVGGNENADDRSDNETTFYLRFKRVGNRFSAYFANLKDLRHDKVWEQSYVDINNKFLGNLKYITMFIGSYQDRPIPNRLRINSVEVTELTTVEEDQTPYIVYPDDVIGFDHVNEDILLNGQVRPDLFTSIGADFFKLKKGENRIVVQPEGSFETLVKFRDRYR